MSERITLRIYDNEPVIVMVERHRFIDNGFYFVTCLTEIGHIVECEWGDIVHFGRPVKDERLAKHLTSMAEDFIGDTPQIINGHRAGIYLRQKYLEWQAAKNATSRIEKS